MASMHLYENHSQSEEAEFLLTSIPTTSLPQQVFLFLYMDNNASGPKRMPVERVFTKIPVPKASALANILPQGMQHNSSSIQY
jgi:hypothetical protein